MRYVCLALVLLAGPACWSGAVLAQGSDPAVQEKLDRVLQAVEAIRQESAEKDRRISSLEASVENLTRLLSEGGGVPQAPGAPAEGTLPGAAREFEEKRVSRGFGGLYTKPFLAKLGQSTYLGGYMDFKYVERNNENDFFDQQRLIPFIYSDVSDRVKFATEIEFEHAGPQNNRGDGEVKIEFATLDFQVKDWLNFRGGLILSPLGKLNLVHDSPIQDLTDRPLVNTFIIPTTLTEAGLGLYGTIEPEGEESEWQVTYEAYLVNGFQGLQENPIVARFDRVTGLRGGRGSQRLDINDNGAGVGRVAYSPFLGLEIGASAHVGPYDQDSELLLAITAVDVTWQSGPFEVLLEGALAELDQNDLSRSRGVPEELIGYYGQVNYHWMPQWFLDSFQCVSRAESTFTSVVRWDQVDLDGNHLDRLTLGLNYRYTEDTVFKFDYQWDIEDLDRRRDDGQSFLFSFATYF